MRAATIQGAAAGDIAPSRRLYGGAGASVRGYGFQGIGPRDDLGNPTGGASLVEFALEARVPTPLFGGAIEVVPFIDAGFFYASPLRDQFLDFVITPIRHCLKESIFHLFYGTFLLKQSNLLARKNLFDERMRDIQLDLYILKAYEQGIQMKLLTTFSSLSNDGVEYLTPSQRLK